MPSRRAPPRPSPPSTAAGTSDPVLQTPHVSSTPQRRGVALRLGLPPVLCGRGQFSVLDTLENVTTAPDLLDVIDALAENYAELTAHPGNSLEDAGSAYTVASDSRAPVERVDPTVAAAVEQTIATAPATASTLLCAAWDQTHGLHPDPTAAYRDAIRAVESRLPGDR